LLEIEDARGIMRRAKAEFAYRTELGADELTDHSERAQEEAMGKVSDCLTRAMLEIYEQI